MRKSIRRKKLKRRKTHRKKVRKGGSYYEYNRNPMRFTSSSTQMGGFSGIGTDTRNTFLPDSVVTLGRTFIYDLTPTTIMGSYNSSNPNPSVQPIMFKNI